MKHSKKVFASKFLIIVSVLIILPLLGLLQMTGFAGAVPNPQAVSPVNILVLGAVLVFVIALLGEAMPIAAAGQTAASVAAAAAGTSVKLIVGVVIAVVAVGGVAGGYYFGAFDSVLNSVGGDRESPPIPAESGSGGSAGRSDSKGSYNDLFTKDALTENSADKWGFAIVRLNTFQETKPDDTGNIQNSNVNPKVGSSYIEITKSGSRPSAAEITFPKSDKGDWNLSSKRLKFWYKCQSPQVDTLLDVALITGDKLSHKSLAAPTEWYFFDQEINSNDWQMDSGEIIDDASWAHVNYIKFKAWCGGEGDCSVVCDIDGLEVSGEEVQVTVPEPEVMTYNDIFNFDALTENSVSKWEKTTLYDFTAENDGEEYKIGLNSIKMNVFYTPPQARGYVDIQYPPADGVGHWNLNNKRLKFWYKCSYFSGGSFNLAIRTCDPKYCDNAKSALTTISKPGMNAGDWVFFDEEIAAYNWSYMNTIDNAGWSDIGQIEFDLFCERKTEGPCDATCNIDGLQIY